jgi:hypothetical protein
MQLPNCATNWSAAQEEQNELNGIIAFPPLRPHCCRYQASRSGYDRGPAWLPESFVLQHCLPPFKAAIEAGVATAMTSYNVPVDTPVVISRTWTRRWLRGDAAFSGALVTDFLEVYNQLDWHRTAANRHEAVVQALQRCSMDLVRYLSKTHLSHIAGVTRHCEVFLPTVALQVAAAAAAAAAAVS